jgi:hypothetical protein
MNENAQPAQRLLKQPTRRPSMMKPINQPTRFRRYEFVRDEDAEFVVYQRKCADGLWQTVSMWMIPGTGSSNKR